MKKLLLLLFFTLAGTVYSLPHTAFTLVSSERKTVKATEIASLEKSQTVGRKEGFNLSFTEKEVRLVVVTGPEDDMLSYRVQGVRNPTIAVPAGATLKILFVNIDYDMRHDVRFGHFTGPFDIMVETQETAGSTKLAGRAEDGTLQAEEIVVKANSIGQFRYFCSIRGHAKDGMWGHIAVGVRPDPNAKPPEKIAHVHSPDEDKDHDHPAQTGAKPSPTPHKVARNRLPLPRPCRSLPARSPN